MFYILDCHGAQEQRTRNIGAQERAQEERAQERAQEIAQPTAHKRAQARTRPRTRARTRTPMDRICSAHKSARTRSWQFIGWARQYVQYSTYVSGQVLRRRRMLAHFVREPLHNGFVVCVISSYKLSYKYVIIGYK